MDKDTFLILASRAVRTFPFGYFSVIIPVYLALTGSAFLVGAFYFVSVMSSMSLLLLLSTIGHRFSVKSLLVFQLVSITFALILLSYSEVPALILLAAAFSFSNWAPGGGSGTGAGPYNTTLNLFLSEKSDSRSRTFVFSLSSILGTLCFAAGALFLPIAGGLDIVGSLALNPSDLLQSGLFVLGAITQAFAVLILLFVRSTRRKSTTIKQPQQSGGETKKVSPAIANGKPRGRSLIEVINEAFKFIVAEFLNGFGNGLFLRLIPLWFFVRFSLNVGTIGVITGVAGVITASFSIYSSRLERKLGSTKSIFLGRGAYSLLIVAMALSPYLPLAIVIYYIALIVSRVAAPVQQSFVFSKIPSADWTRASGMVGVGNSIGSSLGPILGAYLLLDVNHSLAFIVAVPFLFASALIYGVGFNNKKKQQQARLDRKTEEEERRGGEG